MLTLAEKPRQCGTETALIQSKGTLACAECPSEIKKHRQECRCRTSCCSKNERLRWTAAAHRFFAFLAQVDVLDRKDPHAATGAQSRTPAPGSTNTACRKKLRARVFSTTQAITACS